LPSFKVNGEEQNINSMAKKIKNKGDWFLVEVIEMCEPAKADILDPLRRVTTWGNYILINAPTPSEAYDKAFKIGKSGSYTFKGHGQKMKWKFAGIGDLLPIYEDIEDGAEIIWRDYGYIRAKRVNNIVQTKKELLKGIKLKKY
jgi:hypothetical protein